MIVELTPRGWLDARQGQRLRHDVLAALKRGCTAIVVSGIELRYCDVAGLAEVAALIDDARDHSPGVPIWLCHISPDLRCAARLSGVDGVWHMAPDRQTALDHINAEASQSAA
jgi:anti-anti-sigma regulatory factor